MYVWQDKKISGTGECANCALPGKTATQIFCVGRETDLKSINFYIALARVVNKILIDAFNVQKKLQLHLI